MWETKVDYMKRDGLEFAADYFCETARKNAFQAQQIRERIRGHAMLIQSQNASQAIEFDHDEFRLYFLGEGIAGQIRPISARAKAELLGTFRRGPLPDEAMLALYRALTRDKQLDRVLAVKFLLEVGAMDVQTSYTHENTAKLVLQLLSGTDAGGLKVSGMSFGHDALRDKKLTNATFQNCYFSNTSLDLTELTGCTFIDCKFPQLRLEQTTRIMSVIFEGCTVDALMLTARNREIWSPADIRQHLEHAGVNYRNEVAAPAEPKPNQEPAPEIVDLEKLTRYFMRSTHMSESVIRMKLSARGQAFIDQTLPRLLDRNVFVEIENHGAGDQRRFRLNVTLQAINDAMVAANGDFAVFLNQF